MLFDKRKTTAVMEYTDANGNKHIINMLEADEITVTMNVNIDVPGFKGTIKEVVVLKLKELV